MFFLSCTSSAFAWSQEGHVLIAQIAYDQLTLDKQKRVNDLAQTIFDLLSEKQQAQLNKKYPLTVTFAKVAGLPDEWNATSIATIFFRYHTLVPINLLPVENETPATWHYIDTPFPQNRGCVLKADKNIEWAIDNVEMAFSREQLDTSKAIEMIFLEHFFGDIHEPLHTVTNVTLSCDGDRGGNNFCLKENQNHKCIENLHSFWDGALGFLTDSADMKQLGLHLENIYPASQLVDELNITDRRMWASMNLDNMPFIYGLAEYTLPSISYSETGQAMAKKQIVLAGYRLGKSLNNLL